MLTAGGLRTRTQRAEDGSVSNVILTEYYIEQRCLW